MFFISGKIWSHADSTACFSMIPRLYAGNAYKRKRIYWPHRCFVWMTLPKYLKPYLKCQPYLHYSKVFFSRFLFVYISGSLILLTHLSKLPYVKDVMPVKRIDALRTLFLGRPESIQASPEQNVLSQGLGNADRKIGILRQVLKSDHERCLKALMPSYSGITCTGLR